MPSLWEQRIRTRTEIELCRRRCPSTIWLCMIKVIGSELRSNPSRGRPNRAETNWYVGSMRHRIASTTWGDVNINRAKESWAPEPKVQGGYAPFFNRKNGRDQFRVFLIIKLAIFVYFSPHFHTPVVCQSLGSTAVLRIHTVREERSPLIGLQHSLPQAQEVPKKAHCPLSTSPAQNPPNQHNGPPDKVGKNKQREEERWNEWRVFIFSFF